MFSLFLFLIATSFKAMNAIKGKELTIVPVDTLVPNERMMMDRCKVLKTDE
jgi:hypothetical protein